ncbi:MAG: hypothetical protein DSZ06_03070 [Sulfurospirillum sp.]|nr:MAG: hypothetical protein DSZ06_03070 [Sulfurospirillum sp.]
MKKVLLSSMIISVFAFANTKVDDLKWTGDYETLVNLNSNAKNTIEGIDTNKNGIRDDIEYFVVNKYKDKPFQKELFLEAAKKLQTILTLPKNAPVKLRAKLDHELINIYTCRDYMLYKLEAKNIDEELKNKLIFKSKVLNTKDRLKRYLTHKQLVPINEDDMEYNTINNERKNCELKYQKFINKDMITSN